MPSTKQSSPNWRELDKRIVCYLLWYGNLNLQQILYLLQKDQIIRQKRSVQNRLQFLQQQGILEHFRFYRDIGESLPSLYSLHYGQKPKKKAEKVLDKIISDVSQDAWNKAAHLSKLRHTTRYGPATMFSVYEHETFLKNFLLSLAISDRGIVEFWETPVFEYRYKNKKYRLHPDLYFGWRSNAWPSQPFFYFVELQLSIVSINSIENRMQNYLSLFLSEHMRKERNLPYFPTVLFLLPEQKSQEIDRYASVLKKALIKVEPDMKKWSKVFRCGIGYADFYSGRDGYIDPNNEIWFDFSNLKKGQTETLSSLVPNEVRVKLLQLKTKGGSTS